MKKAIIFSSTFLTFLLFAVPALAADGDVSKVETFIQNVIQILVTIAGLVAAGFLYGEELAILPVQEILKV